MKGDIREKDELDWLAYPKVLFAFACVILAVSMVTFALSMVWVQDMFAPAPETQATDWFRLAVRWKEPGQSESEEREYGIGSAHVKSELNDDALFACAIIETAMLLHKSEYAGDASLESIVTLLGNMQQKDFYQAEFEQLIRELKSTE
ncbi:MAG: DUF3520 domain-containing protein [Ruminococcaceae bacterium]|nr:DUF3520 domain-containing protein [Oscillospiraceae bacterium]